MSEISGVAVRPGVGASVLARMRTPFVDRPRTEQVVNVLIAPTAFGLVCGLVLRHSVPAYAVLQVIAFVGGCTGGYEHRSARAGGLRGVVGGALFGAYILAGYLVAGGHLGHTASPFLPLVNAIGGAVLGAIFGSLRGRRDRRSADV